MRVLLPLAALLLANSASAIGPDPASTISGEPTSGGASSLAAGDVNGDGYDDLLIGNGGYTNGETNEGGVLLYPGGPGGIPAGGLGDADAVFESDAAFRGMGSRVAAGGDVNGDGYDDVLIGDPGAGANGTVYIWLGSATGLPSGGPSVASTTLLGAPGSFVFGDRVEFAGDVNNDGYDDVMIGDFGSANPTVGDGAVFIYHGSASGISSSAVPDTTLDGVSFFGRTIAGLGDVDGDGYDDVAAANQGAGFVYLGSASGVPSGTSFHAVFLGFITAATAGGDMTGGDIDGDGFADVAIRSIDSISVFYGSATGLPSVPLNDPTYQILPEVFEYAANEQANFNNNSRIEFADPNGDGFADLVVSDALFDIQTPSDPNPDNGMVGVLLGGALGLLPEEPTRRVRITGPISSAASAEKLGLTMTARGDFNGDGLDDVAGGEPTGWMLAHTFHGTAIALVPSAGPLGLGALALALLAAGCGGRSEPRRGRSSGSTDLSPNPKRPQTRSAPSVSQRGAARSGVAVDR